MYINDEHNDSMILCYVILMNICVKIQFAI